MHQKITKLTTLALTLLLATNLCAMGPLETPQVKELNRAFRTLRGDSNFPNNLPDENIREIIAFLHIAKKEFIPELLERLPEEYKTLDLEALYGVTNSGTPMITTDVNGKDEEQPIETPPTEAVDCAFRALHSNEKTKEVEAFLHVAKEEHIPGLLERLPKGYLPLRFVTCCDIADIIPFMIKAGHDVNEEDKAGQTPLHIASELRKIDSVKRLLEAKAEVNTRDNKGNTPLHYAWPANRIVISPKPFKIAGLLRRHGAYTDIKNNDGKTPYDQLLTHCDRKQELPKCIDNSPEQCNNEECELHNYANLLHWACGGDKFLAPPMVTAATKKELNSRDEYGATLLHKAYFYKNDYAKGLLLEAGANTRKKDWQDKIPSDYQPPN